MNRRHSSQRYNPSGLASRLRECRIARRLSQAQLGRLLAVDPSQVSTWERGKAQPRLEAFAALAVALKREPSYLLWGDHA